MSFGGEGNPIQTSPDLERIRKIPMRSGEYPTLPPLYAEGSGLALKPIQIQALQEALAEQGGAFPIRVGGGKTLISLLLPRVLSAKRPLLLLPGSLVEKTRAEREKLAQAGWYVRGPLELMSYSSLGRVAAQGALEFYGPDLIIADEGHKLKHRKAACTRRVQRYLDNHPNTRFVVMTGTLFEKELKQFAHLLTWALKERAPVPQQHDILREWGEALDPNLDDFRRRAPGAILSLLPGATTGAEAFQHRLRITPGIVFSDASLDYGGSLEINRITYPLSQTTEANFAILRDTACTPDDWALTEAIEIRRVAMQLALGLHYIWSPRPPEAWRATRKVWAKFVREVLARSRTLDSELQVLHAVERGDLDDGGALAAWQKEAPTFEINVVPVWHDDSALIAATEWIRACEEPGIVWTSHGFFGRELARRAKVDYFGAQGLNADKERIDDTSRSRYGKTCVASVQANATGRNLQAWSKALVTAPESDPQLWEQLLGRMHRQGQQADSVTVDVFHTCREYADAFERALDRSRANQDLNGQTNLLLLADVTPPPKRGSGAAWRT